jgi:tripartite-type tricarboxylate transporter receptor subunit TctC
VNKKAFFLMMLLVVFTLALSFQHAAPQEPFYKGKVIRMIVGLSAGGGFDAYARAIARHMPKHIPGNPGTVVENMTGAGSLIAANHIYNRAEADGLTIGHFVGSLFLGQILGQEGINFDARRFEYVGVPAKDYIVCAIPKGRVITSMEQWTASKVPLKIGGTGRGGTIDNAVKTFKEALDLPVQLVSGYKGTANIRLAIDSGELDAGCWEWGGMKVAWQKQLEARDVIVLMQAAPKAYPELSKVPLARNLAKTDQSRKLVEIGVELPGTVSRSFVLSPGTPKERVRILQKAFQDTLKDPEFLAEAKKSRLEVDPISGEEMKRSIEGLFTLDPTVTSKLRDILLK